MRAAEKPGESFARRLMRAAYYAFVLAIPVETILYFKRDEHADDGITVARVVGLALFALAIAHRRLCLRRLPPAFWMIAWYAGAYSLSQLWIPGDLDPRFRAQQLTLLQMGALFLLSYNLFEDAGFREGALRLYGRWASVVALGILLGLFETPAHGGGRSAILTQDPNVTAWLFALGALCLIGDPRLYSPGLRAGPAIPALLGAAVSAAAILRTGSRSGLLAFAGGLLALALCGSRAARGARLALAGLVFAAAAGLVMREFRQGTETAARLEQSWLQGDTAGRTGIYDAAWSMFLERPLLGYGGANNRFTLGVHLNYPDRDMHNVFLAALTEVGVIGAGPLLAALALACWTAWRAGRRGGDGLPFALMCALLIMGGTITASREKIFWVVFAAAAAAGAAPARRPHAPPATP